MIPFLTDHDREAASDIGMLLLVAAADVALILWFVIKAAMQQ
jgi:hypothetical protein